MTQEVVYPSSEGLGSTKCKRLLSAQLNEQGMPLRPVKMPTVNRKKLETLQDKNNNNTYYLPRTMNLNGGGVLSNPGN